MTPAAFLPNLRPSTYPLTEPLTYRCCRHHRQRTRNARPRRWKGHFLRTGAECFSPFDFHPVWQNLLGCLGRTSALARPVHQPRCQPCIRIECQSACGGLSSLVRVAPSHRSLCRSMVAPLEWSLCPDVVVLSCVCFDCVFKLVVVLTAILLLCAARPVTSPNACAQGVYTGFRRAFVESACQALRSHLHCAWLPASGGR